MNEQDRKLSFNDLCGRLPYDTNVSVRNGNGKYREDVILSPFHLAAFNIWDIKAYLRPMWSMTKEEATTLATLWGFEDFTSVSVTDDCVLVFFEVEYGSEHAAIMFSDIVASVDIFDYLNSIHADYRGLIPKGLALPAPEGMYDLKKG